MTTSDNGNRDPVPEAYIQGVYDALKGSCEELHSAEFNEKRKEIVALFEAGRRDFAFEVWLASPIMRESPAIDEDDWLDDDELDDLDDDELEDE